MSDETASIQSDEGAWPQCSGTGCLWSADGCRFRGDIRLLEALAELMDEERSPVEPADPYYSPDYLIDAAHHQVPGSPNYSGYLWWSAERFLEATRNFAFGGALYAYWGRDSSDGTPALFSHRLLRFGHPSILSPFGNAQHSSADTRASQFDGFAEGTDPRHIGPLRHLFSSGDRPVYVANTHGQALGFSNVRPRQVLPFSAQPGPVRIHGSSQYPNVITLEGMPGYHNSQVYSYTGPYVAVTRQLGSATDGYWSSTNSIQSGHLERRQVSSTPSSGNELRRSEEHVASLQQDHDLYSSLVLGNDLSGHENIGQQNAALQYGARSIGTFHASLQQDSNYAPIVNQHAFFEELAAAESMADGSAPRGVMAGPGAHGQAHSTFGRVLNTAIAQPLSTTDARVVQPASTAGTTNERSHLEDDRA